MSTHKLSEADVLSLITDLAAKVNLTSVASKGDTDTPVYFDSTGTATEITSYDGNSSTATTATDYNTTSGGIKDKFATKAEHTVVRQW